MSNILIELSNKSSTNIISNGDFENTFLPVTIYEGDEIVMKNAFIDTVQQSYDQIYIPTDINFTLTVCFYEIDVPVYVPNTNPPQETVKQYHGGYHATNIPHADFGMYVGFHNNNLFKQDVTGLIKAGLYTPTSLAVEITRQLATIKSPQNGAQFTDNRFVWYEDELTWFNLLIDPIERNGTTFDFNNYYTYNNPRNYLTGARQVAVIYNDQGDNKFQFQYLHSPRYDDQGEQIVAWSNNTPINRESGCMFIDMQPRDFWTSLGFNVNDITVKFNDVSLQVPNIQITDFVNDLMTTENLITIDDLFPLTGRYTTGYISKVSNFTRGIYAEQFYSFKSLNAFYIVELVSPYTQLYLSGVNQRNKFINAVVSRNYTQNNFITGYSDSGVTYVHKGEPIVLSSIRSRILNPDTKDTDNSIGPNNYIILNIIKNNNG